MSNEGKDTMEALIDAAMESDEVIEMMEGNSVDADVEPEGETEEDTEDETEEVSEVEGEDDESDEEAGDEDPDLESALAVLRRDGIPPEAIEAMERENLLAYAAKRAQVQQYTAMATGAAGTVASTNQDNREASKPEAEQAPDDPTQAVADSLKPALEELGLDVDSAGAASLTKAILDANEAQLGPLRQELEAFRAQAVQGQVKEMRNRLEGKFPELSEDAIWDQVRATASGLAQAGVHAGEVDEAKRAELLFESAFRALNPNAPSRQEIEKQQQKNRIRRGAQPSSRSSKPKSKPLTSDQKWAKALKMQNEGRTHQEIFAEVGELPLK